MLWLCLSVVVALGILSLAQSLLAVASVRRLVQTPVAEHPAGTSLPKAAVVLCLRGDDPFLEECLQRLVTLNYPNYYVQVVVDNPADPVTPRIQHWERQSAGKLRFQFLQHISPDCYLKSSALADAVESLDSDVEVVAIIDGDTLAHRDWLQHLVTPMQDSSIGAVVGNRWYRPDQGKLGSLVRYIWNALALGPMKMFGMTWCGTIAIRREVFRAADFAGRLRDCTCEDQIINRKVAELGLRLHISSALLMVNHEECSLASCYRFIQRQLLWTRLYHPAWQPIFIQAIVAYALSAVAVIAAGVAIYQGNVAATLLAVGGLGIYAILTAITILVIERMVTNAVCLHQKEALVPLPWSMQAKIGVAMCFALPCYTLAVVTAACMRQVEWRQIHYQIRSDGGLKLISYQPYRVSANLPNVESR